MHFFPRVRELLGATHCSLVHDQLLVNQTIRIHRSSTTARSVSQYIKDVCLQAFFLFDDIDEIFVEGNSLNWRTELASDVAAKQVAELVCDLNRLPQPSRERQHQQA